MILLNIHKWKSTYIGNFQELLILNEIVLTTSARKQMLISCDVLCPNEAIEGENFSTRRESFFQHAGIYLESIVRVHKILDQFSFSPRTDFALTDFKQKSEHKCQFTQSVNSLLGMRYRFCAKISKFNCQSVLILYTHTFGK